MNKNVVFGILTVGMLLASCSKVSNAKTFVYGMFKEPKDLDPAMVTDVASRQVITNVCEGLIGYEGEDDLKMVPKLATSWDVSSDRKTYTFHLRDGVKFHDGTDMDADAVLFSLLRQHDKTNPYYKAAYSYWVGMNMVDNVLSINKTDNKTVVIKLNQPDGTFLAKMAIPMANVISPTAYKKVVDDFDRSPVCTGPFVFKKWEKAQSVLIEKNPNYWDKTNVAKIDKVIFKIINDSSARFLALKKGEIDLAEEISPQDVKSLQSDPNLQIIQRPSLYQDYFWFNTEHKPFDDVRVRQAIAHLIDKQKIVEGALFGYGVVAKNPIPTKMWGYDKDLVDYDYNVETAKQLLKEAGYAGGFEMEISYNKENADRKATAEILQAFLKVGGINVTIKNLEWGTFLDYTSYKNYRGGTLVGWGATYLDPNDFLTMNFSKKAGIVPAINISGWSNDKFDKYNDEALLLNDETQRTALYKKSQEIFHEEVPAIVLYDRESIFGIRKSVKNFVYQRVMSSPFKYLYKD